MKNTLIILALCAMLFAPSAFAQFTTGNDTLVILSGDSCTYYYASYNADADTTDGEPFIGKTAGYDLNGKILVGVDFDTSAAWTAATFSIETSATYNEDADTTGGSPYDWKAVNYEGDAYTFTPETGAINLLKPQVIYALKRYIRFVGVEAEEARRKLVPLIRSAF